MRSNELLILYPHARVEYLWFGEPNNIVLLPWQRRGSSVRSGVRGGECGKEAAVRAALKDGELEAAARQSGAGRRRQRDSE